MGVAIRGCVDDDLDAFALPFDRGLRWPEIGAAILCANINRRLGWRTARADVFKFAGVIGREKDVMMGEVKTRRLGMSEPDERGK